jgi:AraC family transcriptional regulator of adaptative response / DNA-3-methyladenine glycosylase II
VGGGLFTVPRPAHVAGLEDPDLRALGFSRAKCEYLLGIARTLAAGELDLESLSEGSATRLEAALGKVRGLGPWSVHYLMMRAWGLADCVPLGDAGLTRALEKLLGLAERPGPEETLELMKPYTPYRSLATFHLWSWLGEEA